MDNLEPLATDNSKLLWETLRNCVFALGIMLFFSGWFYLYYYFNEFGLSLNDVSFDVTSYYMYAFTILIKPVNLILTLAILIAGIVFNYEKASFNKHFFTIFFFVVIVYFPCEYFLARSYAHENSTLILNGKAKINPIYFSFKNDFLESLKRDSSMKRDSGSAIDADFNELIKYDSLYTLNLLKLNKNLSLFLFYQNEHSYYVFYNPNSNIQYNHSINIFNIPKDAVNYISLSIDKQK